MLRGRVAVQRMDHLHDQLPSVRRFICRSRANVALVLGTRRTTPDGRWSNPHFAHRIEAAAALYRAGKVKRLLVSGDNHVRGYDEPSDMRDALVAAGVPAQAIALDYAGFRTLDSVVRAKEVFGQTSLVVVSEQFHNYRAVFICRHFGIDAVAYSAEPVSLHVSAWPAFREVPGPGESGARPLRVAHQAKVSWGAGESVGGITEARTCCRPEIAGQAEAGDVAAGRHQPRSVRQERADAVQRRRFSQTCRRF